MFLRDLATADSLPALEASVRFAGRRQQALAHNIANIETPDFRPLDLPVAEFQAALSDAVGRRDRDFGGHRGRLQWRETEHLRVTPSGDLDPRPSEPSRNILFHDRNNRDTERLMQDLAENAGAFRASVDILRSRYDILRTAISGRL